MSRRTANIAMVVRDVPDREYVLREPSVPEVPSHCLSAPMVVRDIPDRESARARIALGPGGPEPLLK
ncbi:MAG: hypothetical protein KAI66_02425 [Lentisphaeria bacterium]|nr:hypothetical protein [Lentisphaeria bacterium]